MHECPNNEGIGNKVSYKAKKKHLEHGAYFPGYCAAALELALKNAMSQKCTERIWVCLDNWGFCWIRKYINNPIPCPPHTYDAEVDGLKNYRVEQ